MKRFYSLLVSLVLLVCTGANVSPFIVECNAKSLPSGYVRLEYVQSTGSQYINTGVYPCQSTKIETKASIEATMSWGGIICAEDGTFYFGIAQHGSDNLFHVEYGRNAFDNYQFTKGVAYDLELDRNKFYVNHQLVGTIANDISEFRCARTLHLFKINTSNVSGYSKIKLYFAKIYEDDVLVRYYVPCKNVDGEVGFYDFVNKEFKASETSTALVAGPDYIEQEKDYDIVKDIRNYKQRNYTEVFNLKDSCWYMLNSNEEYEKYGVVEELPTSYKWMTLTSSVASDSHEAKDFNGRLAFRSLRIKPDNVDKDGYIYLSGVQQGMDGASEKDEDYYIHTGTNGNFSLKRLYPGRYIYTKSFTYDVKESQEFTKDGDRYVYTFDQNMYFSHVSGANARISTVEVLVPNFDDVTTYEGKIVVMGDSLFRFDDGQWHTIGANKKGWIDISFDLDTTVLISSMRIDVGQSVGYGCCWVIFMDADGKVFMASPCDGCVLPNYSGSPTDGKRTPIKNHAKVEGTQNTYQIDFSLYDRSSSHKLALNYNYPCFTTQVYLEDYPATYPAKVVPEEIQNGTFVEPESEDNVDDKELHVTTFVVDSDAQPIFAGGFIHRFDKTEIARKGLIVSKRNDDMVIADDTKFYELNNSEDSDYDDTYPIEDFRVIGCTCINEEEFACPLTYLIGNTDYFVRAFVVTNDHSIIYGNIEQIHTQNYNREIGTRHDYANVWNASNYTLFDLMTDEIIDKSKGYYYTTNESASTVRFGTGFGYKFATEWNYKLWYYHNTIHSDKNKMVSRPVMKYKNGIVEISKDEADADKDITIYYSIDENGNRPENFTQVYSEPLFVEKNSIVYCYAISSEGYMSFTNMYVINDFVVEDNLSRFTITDGSELSFEKVETYDILTYTRTFNNTNWQALYVPFSIPVDTLTKYGLEVAELNNVHMYDTDEDGSFDKTTLEFLYRKHGATEPNYSYLIKAAKTGEVVLTLKDVEVKTTEETEIECSSTRKRFKIKGTYAGVSGSVMYNNHYYAMGGGTLVQMLSAEDNLKPQRWYMSIENKDGSPIEHYAPSLRIAIDGIELDDQETGIISIDNEQSTMENDDAATYNLMGQQVKRMVNGLYIKNHKKMIVQ